MAEYWRGTENMRKNLDSDWERSGQYGGGVHNVKYAIVGFSDGGDQKLEEFELSYYVYIRIYL